MEMDKFEFNTVWFSFYMVQTVMGISIFMYFVYKTLKVLPISNYSISPWGRLMKFFSGAYEPIEFIKDSIYFWYFPHYNGLSQGILAFSLLSSISHSIWFIFFNKRKTSDLYEETVSILFGSTLKKNHENVRRKLMKSALQVFNHYFVFYLESFYLGNDWSIF